MTNQETINAIHDQIKAKRNEDNADEFLRRFHHYNNMGYLTFNQVLINIHTDIDDKHNNGERVTLDEAHIYATLNEFINW